MKNLCKYLITLIVAFIIATIFALILFNIKPLSFIKVYMYEGLIYILITGFILFFILMIIAICTDFLEIKDIFSILIIFLSIHISFFVIVPVTIDRSQSVFILSQMDMRDNKTMTKDQVSENFLNVYIDERKAFDKRFEEQLVTGSIERVGSDTYRLTDRGIFLIDIFRKIGSIYKVNMENMR